MISLGKADDPQWVECAAHPGRESHCLSGYCGACWLCAERGRDSTHAAAFLEGFDSAIRRVTAQLENS